MHPRAVAEVFGIEVDFRDHDHVADLIAERLYELQDQAPWSQLPRRAQVRRRNRVKKRLHTKAVERMTVELLAERDPSGEVISWLETIVHLANHGVA